MTDGDAPTGPSPRQIADARFQALTVLALVALLAVVTGLFGNLETHVFTALLGAVGGLRAAVVLRHPERYIHAPDLDAFAQQVSGHGGLTRDADESDRSLRVRLLEAMERVQERIDDVGERRHTAWIAGLIAVLASAGFLIPFLRTLSIALVLLLVAYLIVHRADRLPRRRRASEALALLEDQLAQLSREALDSDDTEQSELTSGG